jgi:hypothetical protein
MPSSVIDRFAYDEISRVLSIWFVAGDRYDYAEVDAFTVEGFKRAPSRGKFFAERIRNRFKAQWVPFDTEP